MSTFKGPDASNTTKIQREDTQRDTKRAKRWREKEEEARNFGPPTLRGHPKSKLAEVEQMEFALFLLFLLFLVFFTLFFLFVFSFS